MPVFLGIPAAAFVEARRGRGAWRLASAASGAGMLGFFVLAGAGFSGQPVPGGLYQRLSLGIGLGWVTALMLRPTLSRILGAGPNCVCATPSSTKPTER